MSTYLVTGGAGFIGSTIVKRLIKDNHKVRVIDNFSTGKLINLKECINKIELIHGDLCNFELVKNVTNGVEFISHQAAIPSVPFSIKDPIAANHSMVSATVNLLKAAVESKSVKRVVQAASAAVYGDNANLPKSEEMLPEPISPYAVSKLSQEYYAKAFYNVYGLETISLRYFNVFGPNQDPKSPYSGVISIFLDKMIKGLNPSIFGDGFTSRDFVYVNDIVEANILALECSWTGKAESINIGRGEKVSLNELVEIMNLVIDTKLTPEYKEERTGDVKHSIADIEKAKRVLGYKPHYTIQAGLKELYAWYAGL